MTERPLIFSGEMVRALLAGRKTQTRRLVSDGSCQWGSPGRWFWPAADFDSAHPDPGFPDPAAGGAYTAGYLKVPAKNDHPTVIRGGLKDTTHRLYPRAYPGDTLWVREAARAVELESGLDGVRFEADGAFIPIANTAAASEAWGALFHYRGRGKAAIGNAVPSIHMPRWCARLRLRVEAVRIERLQDISEGDARAEGVEALADMVVDGLRHPAHRLSYSVLWDELHGRGSWDRNPWVVVLTFTVLPVATELGPQPERGP